MTAAAGAVIGGSLTPAVSGAQTPVATPIALDSPTVTPAPERGGALRLVRPGKDLSNFNPAAFEQDLQIPQSYLEPLVRPDPLTLAPEPWLAEAWEWRDDGRELRFHLREGVLWHDGEQFTSHDAAFSYTVYQQDVNSAVWPLFSLVEHIEAASDRELVVRFRERDGNWLFNAATLPIISRNQYQAFWDAAEGPTRTLSGYDWREDPPVGTGPWQIATLETERVGFVSFEGYWRQGPWLDSLDVFAEPAIADRLETWDSGQSSILWPVSLEGAVAREDQGAKLVAAPAASVMFAAFNFANPTNPAGTFWSDPNVRRAVSTAVDRERYANEVFGGHVQWDAAGTVAQPWAHDDDLKTDRFNREAAAIMLAEAGWADYDGDGVLDDGAGTPFRPIAIVNHASDPRVVAVMARVARDLAEIGIDLIVEVLPDDEFTRRWVTDRDYDLIVYAYDVLPGFTDFDLYGTAWDIRTNPAGWNPGGYSNPAADSAIGEFLQAVTIARQRAALLRLQEAVNQELFGIWLGFPDDLMLVASGVEGFEPDMYWQTARTWTIWRADQQ